MFTDLPATFTAGLPRLKGARIPSMADDVETVRRTAFSRLAGVDKCLLLWASETMRECYQHRAASGLRSAGSCKLST